MKKQLNSLIEQKIDVFNRSFAITKDFNKSFYIAFSDYPSSDIEVFIKTLQNYGVTGEHFSHLVYCYTFQVEKKAKQNKTRKEVLKRVTEKINNEICALEFEIDGMTPADLSECDRDIQGELDDSIEELNHILDIIERL